MDEVIIREEAPDALILALGAKPLILPVPGIHNSNVLIGADLTEESVLGNQVVVIGAVLSDASRPCISLETVIRS